MAMVGLSLPIWRSKLHAGVAEAQAMHQMSEAELRAMTRMIEGQAVAALNELQAAGEQQAAIRDNVIPRARVALDPALAGYAAGGLPLVSVIEAIQALWSVQMEYIDADVRVGLAWTRLGRAIGSYEVLEP
jgi:outer membrane protein TolC